MNCQWKECGITLTPTPTLTPTLLLVLCGSGTINDNDLYYYYDCDGIYFSGDNDNGMFICYDRNAPYTNNVIYNETDCDTYTNVSFVDGCIDNNLINFITNC